MSPITYIAAIIAIPISGANCMEGCIDYPYLDTVAQFPKDYRWMPLAMLLVQLGWRLFGASVGVQSFPEFIVAAVARRISGERTRPLVLDDLRHSYVDLEDPTHLQFAYAQRFGDVQILEMTRWVESPEYLHVAVKRGDDEGAIVTMRIKDLAGSLKQTAATSAGVGTSSVGSSTAVTSLLMEPSRRWPA